MLHTEQYTWTILAPKVSRQVGFLTNLTRIKKPYEIYSRKRSKSQAFILYSSHRSTQVLQRKQYLLAHVAHRFTYHPACAQKKWQHSKHLASLKGEKKKCLTSWSYSRKTWKLRSLLSTGWEEIRWRKISCDDTVFLKTARYSLKEKNRLRFSFIY